MEKHAETVHEASWRWQAGPCQGLFPYAVLICLFDRLSGQHAGSLPKLLNYFLNGTTSWPSRLLFSLTLSLDLSGISVLSVLPSAHNMPL